MNCSWYSFAHAQSDKKPAKQVSYSRDFSVSICGAWKSTGERGEYINCLTLSLFGQSYNTGIIRVMG